MHYMPTTKEDEKKMLKRIGIKNFEELIKIIPKNFRIKNLNLDKPMSELEIESEIESLGKINKQNICFIGNGIYDHYIPKAIDFITSRSEFYTAYTPYQPEVSQGTLQCLYEFQSMICRLSGMDVANASLYDGASALAEACSLSISYSKKNVVLYSSTLNAKYIDVVKTYLNPKNIKFIEIPCKEGKTQLSFIKNIKDQVACLIVQSPNSYGILEDFKSAKRALNNQKTILIAVSDPLTLSVLEPPGTLGADIYVGEGQVLGTPMSFGGPLLGLISAKKYLMRKMPGRIVGKTVDLNGNVGFVLTLQTREQHIRRENATSNICTNQGLLALRALVYMSLLGESGMQDVIQLCYNKSHYAAKKIASLPNFNILYNQTFLKEFVVETQTSAEKIINYCNDNGIYIQKPSNDQTDRRLLICVTEKRTKSQIDKLYEVLKLS